MPNHLHAIVKLAGIGSPDVGFALLASRSTHGRVDSDGTHQPSRRLSPASGSLGAIVRSFKAATTRGINAMRRTPGTPVWQRGYYEHIIGYEGTLLAVRKYIAENPQRWLERRAI
jgi:REP element-mobilizing transposase RayT